MCGLLDGSREYRGQCRNLRLMIVFEVSCCLEMFGGLASEQRARASASRAPPCLFTYTAEFKECRCYSGLVITTVDSFPPTKTLHHLPIRPNSTPHSSLATYRPANWIANRLQPHNLTASFRATFGNSTSARSIWTTFW